MKFERSHNSQLSKNPADPCIHFDFDQVCATGNQSAQAPLRAPRALCAPGGNLCAAFA